MEDLGASEEAERAKLPHDVLTNTVRQAGVPLRVAGQREDVLQHPRQGVPAVLCHIETLSSDLLVNQVRIFPPAEDDLDRPPLSLCLVSVERGQDVVCREGVEVVLGGQPVLLQAGVDLAGGDLRSEGRPRVKCQPGRNADGDWPGGK